MRAFRPLAAVAVVVAAVTWAAPAHAATYVVGPGGGAGLCESPAYSDIQDAVDAATGNDTIVVCAGTYSLTSTIVVDVNVTIVGEGFASTIISGQDTVRIIDVQAPATGIALRDLTLIDGEAGVGNGGAVRAAASGMTVTATDVSFETNRGVGGAAIFADGDVTIDGGRMVYNGSAATLYGGAVWSQGGEAIISNAQLAYNNAKASGGAGGAVQADVITISDSEVGHNEADDKGGALSASTVTIARTTFGYNTTIGANSLGGAVWSTSTDVEDSTFAYNEAEGGGALASTGGITVSRSTFGYNAAVQYGGAVYSTGLVIQADNSTFVGNTAGTAGGALQAGSSIALANDTFTGNSAPIGSSVLTTTFSTSGSIFADEGGWGCQVTNPVTPGIAGNLTLDDTCTGQVTTLDELALQSLADNGGPTQTVALGVDSIAIGFDTECLLSVDQRGFPRPAGGACDSGAYEAEAVPDASQVPPPWLKAFGRATAEVTCPSGTAPSWAYWPNDGRGGFTCESALVYNPNTGRWEDRVGFVTS
jgi:predicted outer membrane repeat protein